MAPGTSPTRAEVITAFREFLEANGVVWPGPIHADARLHREHVHGDRRGTRNLRYTLALRPAPSGWVQYRPLHDQPIAWSWGAGRGKH